MKLLKISGTVLLVLVVLVVVLGLVSPRSYEVERSVIINAPKHVVFEHVKYWKNWQDWSPWAAQDSSMQVTVEGIDGEAGSKYVWNGDPDLTGKGEMTNTGVTENQEMTFDLHFMEPWESHSQGFVRLSDANGGTQVTWGFYGDYPFPLNIMLLFANMDKMIGPDFEHGLELLKRNVEQEWQNMQNMKNEQPQGAQSYTAK